ncbi:MAG: DHHW family protein [Sarcina sp.]
MKNKSLVYMFFISIGALAFLDVINKEKIFSEIENRYLETKPSLTVDKVLNGEYTKSCEEYINDNFIGRDYFINLKSISESLLLKLENNEIIYGKYGYMFEKFKSLDIEILTKNVEAIKTFNENSKVDMDFMLIPYSASVYTDYYPIHLEAVLVNEVEIINKINEYIGNKSIIDAMGALLENKKSDIYYKTDHHWNTYGAYLAYVEYCEKNEIKEIVNLNDLKENNVEGFLGTFYSKSKLFNAKKDTLLYYDMPHLTMKIGDGEWESIYKVENLKKRDKYSIFLDGNHSKTIIKNSKNKNGKKLLVLKDSFANSFIPFIANNYEEVHVIDLRHYPLELSEYMDENSFDKVLCLYSLNNFSKDRSIARINF